MAHDLNTLRLFVLVAQNGGYAAASRSSGIPRATLSRRIAGLEKDIGQRLIERSPRSFRLTEPGRILFEPAREAIARADQALDQIEGDGTALTGTLRVAAPPSLLGIGYGDFMTAFLARHPGLTLSVEASSRRVDLREEAFDCALRVSDPALTHPDLSMVHFATVRRCFVAAPSWQDMLRPHLHDSLQSVPPLVMASPRLRSEWTLRDSAGQHQSLSLSPRLRVQDLAMLRSAAIAGLGLALMPAFFVTEALEEGVLIRPEFDLMPDDLPIHAVHLGTRGMRPALRQLLDWLKLRSRAFC